MSSSPRRVRLPLLSASPAARTLLGLLLVAATLVAPPVQRAGLAAGNYVLSSTPDGTGEILVDDDLDVYLNGVLIHSDGTAPAGERPPIPVMNASVGDVLQFVLRDTYGNCAILSALYLVDSQGRSTPAMPKEFNQGCGNDPVDRGEVLNYTFIIPDLDASGPPYQDIEIPGNSLTGLTRGPGGYLYGVTYGAGNTGGGHNGNIFRVAPDFSAVETVHSFNGDDGKVPYGEMVLRGTVLFGTTQRGGAFDVGTVFSFDTATQQLRTLHSFPSSGPFLPSAPLLLLGEYLFGSVSYGVHGAVWRMKIDGSGFTYLHVFGGFDGSSIGGLVLGPDGYLYGTAVFGGDYGCEYSGGCGTIFRVRPDGTGPGESGFELVWVFSGWRTAGGNPNRQLIVGSDGQLYGTGVRGVFRLSPNPAAPNFQVIHVAADTIWAPPIEGLDGRLYVAQYFDFVVGYGQVYSMTKAGADVVLHHQFSASGAGFPYGMLFQDTPGVIYGTTEYSSAEPYPGKAFVIRTQSNRSPVAVANLPSTAAVGANCLADVVLDGSGSSDPDGDALTYSWRENGVEIATGETPTVSLPVGTHVITLRVTDPSGAIASTTATVTVTSGVTLSYAGPTGLQQFGSNVVQALVTNAAGPVAGASVTFTLNGTSFPAVTDAAGVASVDVGAIAGTTAVIQITYPDAPCGPEATTVAIPVNRWPTASPSAPSPVFVGDTCTAPVALSANAAEADGDPLTYDWSEGGVSVSTTASPTLSRGPGLYTFDLLVSDGRGGSAAGSVSVEVRKSLLGLAYTGPAQFVVGVATPVTARLTDGANAPIAGATIDFALTGQVVQGTTDANGVATATLTPSNNGSQELTVSFAGDACREAVTFRTTVSIDRATATVVVTKLVVNDDGGLLAAGAFSINVASPGATTTIPGDPNGTPVSVNVGDYVVSEIPYPGYATTYSADCSGTIASGETRTCTVVNDDIPTTLTLTKVVINDNGGTALPAAFQLTANGQPFASGVSQTVPAGDYVLAESGGPAGYAPGPWNCVGAPQAGSTVSIPPGATVSCTIANNDVAGTLTVQAVVIDDDGSPSDPGAVTILVSGVTAAPASFGLPGAVVTLHSGNYTVTTGPIAGFTIGYSADCQGFMPLGGVRTCTITIDDEPLAQQPPTAEGRSVQTSEDTPVAITLSAADPNGDPLTYAVVTGPLHGTLSGTAPDLTYTPAPDYNGPDSFTFIANDGQADSNVATIDIVVVAVNDAPTAIAGGLTTDEDTAAALTLMGSDPDGDALTYAVQTPPQHGTLSGVAPNLTYTPDPDYSGPDAFTFTVSDGTLTSAPAVFDITVAPVNDAPTAIPQTLTTPRDTALPIVLSATDPDSVTLTFAVATGPAHGTIQGTGSAISYVPDAGYVGPDSFTFTASDGLATGAPAAISITVTASNTAPVAFEQSVSTPVDTAVAITLTADDIDNDFLTFAVVTPPAHGTLSGTAPALVYTPNAGYAGPDTLTFRVNDGQADSNLATVSITVVPISTDLTVTIQGSATVAIGQPLTYLVTVRNNGPDVAANPFVTVQLPSGLVYNGTAQCTGTATLTCSAGPLASGGQHTYSIDVLAVGVGQQIVTASVPTADDPAPADNIASVTTLVEKAATTTILTAPASSTFGQNVTLEATVSGYGPTGTVTFLVDGAAIGSGTLTNGTVSLTTTLATGTRTLSASYGGDGNNFDSTSAPLTHVVQPVQTTTTLTSSPNPSVAGQLVTFSATVVGLAPAGTVTFTVDGVAQTPVPLGAAGTATFQTTTLGAGAHVVTAAYSGDVNHTNSTSEAITQQVGQAVTTTTLEVQPNPAAPGTMVLLTARVTGATPTGLVTFLENNAVLGTAQVSNGVATLVIDQGKKGSRQLSASYPGDANNLPSASPKVRLTTK